MSYAHHDDAEQRVSRLRNLLISELRSQTGEPFDIFKDDDDIGLGEPWRRRLEQGLAAATFLLPILTPSFLKSPYCREELQTFLEHERSLGRGDLVLPIYYIDCSELTHGPDEAAARALRTLLERQYFDWRALRELRPSDQRVRRGIAELARQITRAVARMREPVSRTEARREPAERSGSRPRSLSDVLDALFDRDPVTSRAAAREAAVLGPDAVPAIVDRLREVPFPTTFVLRELLGALPDVSGPLMVERIKEADRDWKAAIYVPDCFSHSHSDISGAELAAFATSGTLRIDAVRKAVEALGFIGSTEWAGAILRLLRDVADGDDLYGKYHGFAVEALARIVALTPLEVQHLQRVSNAFAYLEAAVELVAERGWRSSTYPNLMSILSRCGPHHGDRLLERWLTSPRSDFRDLGAYALGGIGLRRALDPLLERATDPAEEPSVRTTSIFAVGAIGGPDAVVALEALDLPDEFASTRDTALAYSVIDAGDDEHFAALARRVAATAAAERCWVYRAAGRRRDGRLVDLVRRGLGDADTSVRGDAALALARLAGREEREALLRAYAEAATSRERVLAELALLAIGETPTGDPELLDLRDVLAGESFLYRSPTQRDIVDVLRSCGHPAGAEIAAAWEPIYAAGSAY